MGYFEDSAAAHSHSAAARPHTRTQQLRGVFESERGVLVFYNYQTRQKSLTKRCVFVVVQSFCLTSGVGHKSTSSRSNDQMSAGVLPHFQSGGGHPLTHCERCAGVTGECRCVSSPTFSAQFSSGPGPPPCFLLLCLLARLQEVCARYLIRHG